MRLHQVAMTVADLDATEAFYRDVLEVDFVARFDSPGLLFFDFDGVRVLFEAGENAGHSSVLYLWVEDIDAALARLQAKGVSFDGPPQPIHVDREGRFGQAGETEWMAFFKDPSGNTLALATRRF